jgi:hypothetical protein
VSGAIGLGRRVLGPVAVLLFSSTLVAQDLEPPAESPPPAVSTPVERETLLPNLDFYFPEGELEFRLNTLVKGSFYEGQIRYNFVKGDIEAFLRYKYYGRENVYQLGLFDSVEFEPIEKASNDFERTRGGLFLLRRPLDYHNRLFLLFEVDRITSSKQEFQFTTNKTDTFVRFGYQLGTPDDVRLNAIVGETRAERRNLFTAHRRIGPASAGFSAALTWGFEALLGDFDFVKLELGGLKRFRLGADAFVVLRAHGGTFLRKAVARPLAELDSTDRYSIPRGEYFRLDGRDNLKGLQEKLRGTEELHATTELFLPWFLNSNRKALGVDWDSWYWILYGGYGTIGFDRDELSKSANYLTDVGVGFETSFRLKDYVFFIAGVVAHIVDTDDGVEARFDVKALH